MKCPKNKVNVHILSMPTTKLSAEQTKARFGVSKTIKAFPSKLTEQEAKNVGIVLQYMRVINSTHSSYSRSF
jgi:hypothetical protein